MVNPITEQLIYTRPAIFTETPNTFCPGCTHGIGIRLVAEVLEEMNVTDHTIGVASVGCSVFAYIVFTYQGDGDLASIGMGEIVAASARGENITVIFINNTNYGMTGGQMAPTTLPGQITTSSPTGRDVETMGYPIRTAELLATNTGSSYVVRRSLHDPKNIRLAKKAIRTAFETQARGLGFSLVELLSTCPTNWGYSPAEAQKWLEEHMLEYYPLGDFKVSPAVADLKV
jgi:2-oxoglutarate ferredoxin oxidoreductase subunit beta